MSRDQNLEKATTALNALGEKLSSIDRASCQINLVKSRHSPSLKNTRYLEITAALGKQIKQGIEGTLGVIISDVGSHGLGTFAFDVLSGGRVSAIPTGEFQKVADWFGLLPALDAIKPLGKNDNHLSNVAFVHTAVTFTDSEVIYLFHRTTDLHAVKRSGWVAAHIVSNKYDFLNPETTLLLDMSIDFFVWRNFFYIINFRRFESVVNFREITRDVASGIFDAICKAVPVTDETQLHEVLFSGNRHPNKLASLYKAPHLAKMTMDRIKAVIAKRGLSLKVENINGVEKLKVDPSNIVHIVEFLQVVSDDLVISEITDLEYVSTEKTPA